MAAQENHMDVVRYLLENGGNQSIATEVSRLGLLLLPNVSTTTVLSRYFVNHVPSTL